MTPPLAGGATSLSQFAQERPDFKAESPMSQEPSTPQSQSQANQTVGCSSHRLLAKPLSLQLGPVKAWSSRITPHSPLLTNSDLFKVHEF